jgi:putative addiction module component (TIGR02574 family)
MEVRRQDDQRRYTGSRFVMSPSLSELLKLSARERAELAMALWESLSGAERESELELMPEEGAELDRRWADHVRRPESAIPWDEVRRQLLDRE